MFPPYGHDRLPLTFASIDLAALRHNLTVARKHLASSCEILAVVKADAYGHGAPAVCQALVQAGVNRFGVATLQEGISLREAGIQRQIVVLGAVSPKQLPDLVAHDLTPVIYDHALVPDLLPALRSRRAPYTVHIKVDTGMGRLGISPSKVLPLLQSAPFKGPLSLEGLMTHLADADASDRSYTELQLDRFRKVLFELQEAGVTVPLAHAANSAALLHYPHAHFQLVRPGLMLYGYSPTPHLGDFQLMPVLTLVSRIVQIRSLAPGESTSYNRSFTATRRTRIAVLPIGYADGLNRHLSNRGTLLVKGKHVPIVGRICMDLTLIDITDIPDARVGDEVVLIGRQGALQLWAGTLAETLDTIPYEVLCSIGARVPRIYRY